ncbi:hypothetical protein BGZ79_010646 [Entomortierella chlamydospora]|nr:hypothetical protein BGZ79_010646 [Entomortierella chlamydospora]
MGTSSNRSYTTTSFSSRSSVSGVSTISSASSVTSNNYDEVNDRNMEFIYWLANRLTSYDEVMHKEILEDFFTDDAKYIHPALTVEGRYNIRKVFRVWTSLNKDEPKVTNIVFDHQDSWTLEGIVQSMPLLGWWYDHVARNILGTVMTSAGGFLHTANQTTGYLQFRAEEVQKMSTEIIEKSSAEIQLRSKEMTAKAQLMVDQAKENVEKKVITAREEVTRMRRMFTGTKAITANGAEVAA